jgi:hypothetical protein
MIGLKSVFLRFFNGRKRGFGRLSHENQPHSMHLSGSMTFTIPSGFLDLTKIVM